MFVFFNNLLDLFFSYFIIYTKVFQWFNIKSNFQSINLFLNRFTNEAPYVNSDIDNLELSKLTSKIESKGYRFEIEEKPINSGTISLVFRAKLINSDKTVLVAIKVLRVNVETKIRSAIFTILFFSRILEFFLQIRIVDLILNIQDKLLEQVNFKKEIENLILMQNLLKKYKAAKTVTVFAELCTSNCIVMEYIIGKTLYNLSDEEKIKCVDSFSSLISFCNFKKQIFHLDMHPGNLLFVERLNEPYQICFLDMGMISKVKTEYVNLIYRIINIIYSIDHNMDPLKDFVVENGCKIIQNVHNFEKSELLKPLLADLNNYVLFQVKKPLPISQDLLFLIHRFKKLGYEMNSDFYEILLSFVSFLGMLSSLDVNSNFDQMILNKINRYRVIC